VRLQIDDLIFDSASRQVWVEGAEAHLSPKAFDLLALLIERRPDAVSKTDLHARLWPGTFVSDSSLPSLVSEIRDAIADHRREPRLIRTVHGFGYAFQSQQAALADTSVNSAPSGWLVGTSSEIALFTGENVLGREGPGVIVLKSSTVSRRHARITIAAAGVVLEDLESKNGTYADDRAVTKPTTIVDGCQVRIGSLLFTFRLARSLGSTETLSSQRGPRLRP
jgi:DNA-binding winged helix-turn-helix (wHTH) protein